MLLLVATSLWCLLIVFVCAQTSESESPVASPSNYFLKQGQWMMTLPPPQMEQSNIFSSSEIFDVFMYSIAGAFATGLGVLPFYFYHFDKLSQHYVGVANCVAAGVMLAASFGLMNEGFLIQDQDSINHTLMGMVMGVCSIHFFHHLFDGSSIDIGALHGADARKACLVLSIMTIHSFAEGLGIGVSFCGIKGASLGRVMAIAIGLHNIPEGLCIALIMLPRGESVRRSIFYAVLSSVPQPLVSVPAYLLVSSVQWLLPFGFGIAAGAMVWLVVSEILPDALQHVSNSTMATVVILAMISMIKIQSFIHEMEEDLILHRS